METELFQKKCQENQLKITPQRLSIYEELRKSKEHPSVDLIYKKIRTKFPHISFDTVYRTMLTFSQIGLVRVVEGYGDTKRYDPNVKQHHHFRCVECHKIVDFHNKAYDQLEVPTEMDRGYKVLDKKVVLEGLCPSCSKRA